MEILIAWYPRDQDGLGFEDSVLIGFLELNQESLGLQSEQVVGDLYIARARMSR